MSHFSVVNKNYCSEDNQLFDFNKLILLTEIVDKNHDLYGKQ